MLSNSDVFDKEFAKAEDHSPASGTPAAPGTPDVGAADAAASPEAGAAPGACHGAPGLRQESATEGPRGRGAQAARTWRGAPQRAPGTAPLCTHFFLPCFFFGMVCGWLSARLNGPCHSAVHGAEDEMVVEKMFKVMSEYTHPQAWRCVAGGSWAKPDSTTMPWKLREKLQAAAAK